MISSLGTPLLIAGLVLAAFGLVTALRDRAPDLILLGAAAVLELGLLAFDALAAAAMIRGNTPAQTGLFIAYLIGGLFLLPVAGVWALSERNKWSSVVVAVAGLAFAVLIVRMQAIWEAPHG